MWPILRNFLMVLCLMAVGAIAVGSYTHLFNASSGGKHAQLPENTIIRPVMTGKSRFMPVPTGISGLKSK